MGGETLGTIRGDDEVDGIEEPQPYELVSLKDTIGNTHIYIAINQALISAFAMKRKEFCNLEQKHQICMYFYKVNILINIYIGCKESSRSLTSIGKSPGRTRATQ